MKEAESVCFNISLCAEKDDIESVWFTFDEAALHIRINMPHITWTANITQKIMAH